MKMPSFAGVWIAGRANRRHFIWAWSLPIFLYLTYIAESLLGPIPFKYDGPIMLREIAAVVLAGMLSSKPYRRKRVSKGAAFFWIIFVPVVLLIFLSMLPFHFPVTITEIPTSIT